MAVSEIHFDFKWNDAGIKVPASEEERRSLWLKQAVTGTTHDNGTLHGRTTDEVVEFHEALHAILCFSMT